MTQTDEIQKLNQQIECLQGRLQELEETMASVCGGTADAIVVSTVDGDKVFTLKTAEQPYRLFVEQMLQGAVILSDDDTVLYCNKAFAGMVQEAPEVVVGKKIQMYISPACQGDFDCLLKKSRQEKMVQHNSLALQANDGSLLVTQVSAGRLEQDEFKAVGLVFVELPLS